MRVLRLLTLPLLIVLGVMAPPTQARPGHDDPGGPIVQVIATGLDSPRHLAFNGRGDLYVAEAGRGGSGPCFIAGEGPACMGDSGAVTKIDRLGRQSRVTTGLASMANTPGNDNAIGPHGITTIGDRVLITNGGPTEPRVDTGDPNVPGPPIPREDLAAQDPVADLFGRVLLLRRGGRVRSIADIWAFERDHNPDATVGNPAIDSNPDDVLFDGRRLVVSDAGGNALDTVDSRGRVSNLAVFPNRLVPNPFGGPDIPMQAVPTSVVQGPDGKYYVSQLTGFPFPVGGARIYRVDPRTGAMRVFARGFTNLMDLAYGRDGTLYALEIDHDSLLGPGNEGAIYAVDRNGRKRMLSLPAGSLPFPGGITADRDALYVTTNGGSPGGGQVVRIRTR